MCDTSQEVSRKLPSPTQNSQQPNVEANAELNKDVPIKRIPVVNVGSFSTEKTTSPRNNKQQKNIPPQKTMPTQDARYRSRDKEGKFCKNMEKNATNQGSTPKLKKLNSGVINVNHRAVGKPGTPKHQEKPKKFQSKEGVKQISKAVPTCSIIKHRVIDSKNKSAENKTKMQTVREKQPEGVVSCAVTVTSQAIKITDKSETSVQETVSVAVVENSLDVQLSVEEKKEDVSIVSYSVAANEAIISDDHKLLPSAPTSPTSPTETMHIIPTNEAINAEFLLSVAATSQNTASPNRKFHSIEADLFGNPKGSSVRSRAPHISRNPSFHDIPPLIESSPAQQPKSSPSQQPKSSTAQQPKSSPLQQPKITPPQQPKSSQPQQPKSSQPEQPKSPPTAMSKSNGEKDCLKRTKSTEEAMKKAKSASDAKKRFTMFLPEAFTDSNVTEYTIDELYGRFKVDEIKSFYTKSGERTGCGTMRVLEDYTERVRNWVPERSWRALRMMPLRKREMSRHADSPIKMYIEFMNPTWSDDTIENFQTKMLHEFPASDFQIFYNVDGQCARSAVALMTYAQAEDFGKMLRCSELFDPRRQIRVFEVCDTSVDKDCQK